MLVALYPKLSLLYSGDGSTGPPRTVKKEEEFPGDDNLRFYVTIGFQECLEINWRNWKLYCFSNLFNKAWRGSLTMVAINSLILYWESEGRFYGIQNLKKYLISRSESNKKKT